MLWTERLKRSKDSTRATLVAAALAVAAALGAVPACSSTTTPNVSTGTPDAGDDGGGPGDDDAGGDAGPRPESCDPYEPRATTPPLYIGPTGLEDKIVALIQGAKTSIDVLMYEIDRQPIIDALVAAKKRGVAVRFVSDHAENAPAKSALTAGGVEVHDASAIFPYYHVKVMILDGARALVGSPNMNGYSMQSERNYAIVDSDWDDIADLQAIFDNDFAGKSSAPDLSCTRLVVSPVNSHERILDLVKSAKKLDLSVMYVTDPQLVQAVKDRQAAGVPVRVLLADPGWIQGNAQSASDLAAAQVPVKYFKSLDLHAKLVLTDRAALVASENLSTTSLDQNREVGVIVTNDQPLAAVRKQFESDWGAGVAP